MTAVGFGDVWFARLMSLDVTGQLTGQGKALAAVGTVVGFEACVHRQMLF